MDELKKAKENLINLSRGRKKPQTLDEARKNLILSDPGINIAKTVVFLNKKDYFSALTALLGEIVKVPDLIDILMLLIKIKEKKN